MDTSALVEAKEAVIELGRGGNIVVVPRKVIHELDDIKRNPKKDHDTTEAAKDCNSYLNYLRESGLFNHHLSGFLEGTKPRTAYSALPNGGLVFWEPKSTALEKYMSHNGDNIILGTARFILERAPPEKNIVTLITEDTNLLLKADAEDIGLKAERLRMGKLDLSQGTYSGYRELFVSGETLDRFYRSGQPRERYISLNQLGEVKDKTSPDGKPGKFFWNEGVVLIDREHNDHVVITRYDASEGGVLRDLRFAQGWSDREKKKGYHPITIFGFQPGDRQQILAWEYILDPTIKLVILDGVAGTGKTRLMVTAGVSMILNDTPIREKLQSVDGRGHYRRITILRPEYSVTSFDIGTVPGGKHEKLSGWLLAYFRAMERLNDPLGYEVYPSLRKTKSIEEMPTSWLRGYNIENEILLADELQNGNRHLAFTLGSRLCEQENGKMILAGDPRQIDNPYVHERNNALNLLKELFKGYAPSVAVIKLVKSYRGSISTVVQALYQKKLLFQT